VQVTASRRVAAEALGTALLVAVVVGSGIMAARLAPDAPAIALLANTLATGAALVALIVALGPVSGAHFNPVVTLSVALCRELSPGLAGAYVIAQVAGGIGGAILANAMFELPPVAWSTTARSGSGVLLSEVVASFGLITIVIAVGRRRAAAAPYAVAAFVTAGYWFTASTCFANPAVTLGRAFTDSFAGIRPTDVPAFVCMQVAGALAATVAIGWLVPRGEPTAPAA
jgi:glycerol uptake facilitator-like aquaporin